jgi:hypothetical protein
MPAFNYLLLLYDVYWDIDLLLEEIFLFIHYASIENPSKRFFCPFCFIRNCLHHRLIIASIITFRPLFEFRGQVLIPSPVATGENMIFTKYSWLHVFATRRQSILLPWVFY